QKLILIIEGEKSTNLLEKISSIPFEKNFQKPKEIIFIEKIPRTPNGKVNRMELKTIL
ncbi:MAG: AMP-dependent synthetase, partial [Chryseobacterium sp.]